MREVFALTKKSRLKDSRTLYFSPSHRMEASEGAVDGRNRLGVAVNNAQNMKAAYNSLMHTPKKVEIFEVQKWDERARRMKTIMIKRTARDSEEWREFQRDITRAQLGLASDPLDEAGLKSGHFYLVLYINTVILGL